MYNSKENKNKILGYVYLFIAVIGMFYYVLSFTVNLQKPTPEQLLQEKYCKMLVLLGVLINLIIGVYIRTATHKMLLFFQALATMLILAAQGFYTYALFSIQSSPSFSTHNATDAATVLLVIGILLHAVNLFENRFALLKANTDKPKYQFEDVDF